MKQVLVSLGNEFLWTIQSGLQWSPQTFVANIAFFTFQFFLKYLTDIWTRCYTMPPRYPFLNPMLLGTNYSTNRHLGIEGVLFATLIGNPLPVWPEKIAKRLLRLPKNDFIRNMIHFDTFTKNCLRLCEVWVNDLLPMALKSRPKSNKSPNLVTLPASDTQGSGFDSAHQ